MGRFSVSQHMGRGQQVLKRPQNISATPPVSGRPHIAVVSEVSALETKQPATMTRCKANKTAVG